MALRIPVRHSKGFSLIELMIAVVFIMISMLALLNATVMSIQTNLENDVRNTAIRVTNQTAEVLLALKYEDAELNDGSGHVRDGGSVTQDEKGFPPTALNIRGFQQAYTIQWAVATRTSDIKEVTITVTYMHRNTTHTNTAVIYKHKAG